LSDLTPPNPTTGDTLRRLAHKFVVTPALLVQWNPDLARAAALLNASVAAEGAGAGGALEDLDLFDNQFLRVMTV
jgi:hypothetical protein